MGGASEKCQASGTVGSDGVYRPTPQENWAAGQHLRVQWGARHLTRDEKMWMDALFDEYAEEMGWWWEEEVGPANLRSLATKVAAVDGGHIGRLAAVLGVRVLDLVCSWVGDSAWGTAWVGDSEPGGGRGTEGGLEGGTVISVGEWVAAAAACGWERWEGMTSEVVQDAMVMCMAMEVMCWRRYGMNVATRGVQGGNWRPVCLEVVDLEERDWLIAEVVREGLGPGLAQRIRVRHCLELLRRLGRLRGPGVEHDDGGVCGKKMKAREVAMRQFWEGGAGRLLGDADMPEGADLGSEGAAEEVSDMARAERGSRQRGCHLPGVPGQRRGLGTGMLFWKVPEVGEWRWDVLEVRAAGAREEDSAQGEKGRKEGRRGGGGPEGKAKRPRRR